MSTRDLPCCSFCVLLVSSCLFTGLSAWARTAGGHASDIIELLFGKPNVQVGYVRDILVKEFNPAIDNMSVLEMLSEGEHRLYGHWGFSGRIPFRSNPNLRLYISKHPEMKNIIIEAWKRDQERMLIAVSKFVGLTDRARLRGFTGILYDMHILGDWSTANTVSLQNVDAIINDLKKNLRRVFDGDRAYAREVIKQLEAELKRLPTRAGNKERARVLMRFMNRTLRNRLAPFVRTVPAKYGLKTGVVSTVMRAVSYSSAAIAIAWIISEITWEKYLLDQRRKQERECRRAEMIARWNILTKRLKDSNLAIHMLLTEN